MRQWLEAGYFKGDLPISQNSSGPFRPLSQIFSDLSAAFLVKKGPTPEEVERQRVIKEQQQQRAQAEEAQRQKEEMERKAREERLREERLREERLREERLREERAEEEAKAAAAAAANQQPPKNGANESSAQLKIMLGLGGSSALPKEEPVPPPKAAAPAWGGAARPASRKSMSEIQQEEAQAAAVAAMSRQRTPGSGWANVAASRGGSTGWQGTSAAKATKPLTTTTTQSAPKAARSFSVHQHSAAPAAPTVQRSKSVSAPSESDPFGAKMKMSDNMEQWCKDQMRRLNGTDDLTLVAFCMTLTDPEEIRQYLTAYLGMSPAVNSFATEFINRKNDDWESTAKKGRKKKAR